MLLSQLTRQILIPSATPGAVLLDRQLPVHPSTSAGWQCSEHVQGDVCLLPLNWRPVKRHASCAG